MYGFEVIFYTKKMIDIDMKNLDYKNATSNNNKKIKSVNYNSIYSICYMFYILGLILLVFSEIDFFEKDAYKNNNDNDDNNNIVNLAWANEIQWN